MQRYGGVHQKRGSQRVPWKEHRANPIGRGISLLSSMHLQPLDSSILTLARAGTSWVEKAAEEETGGQVGACW